MDISIFLNTLGDDRYMNKEANKNTELKKMAMKGSLWFSLLWSLLAIIPYHLYVLVFDIFGNAQSDLHSDILTKFSFSFFQFVMCFLGMVIARFFMRKVGTELPVWKNKSFLGAVKNLFTSLKTLHTVIPFIVFIIVQIAIFAPANKPMAWYTIVLFLVYLYFDGLTEEYAFRGILAELLIIKRRETKDGVFYSILFSGILSGLYTALMLVIMWGAPAQPIFIVSVVMFDCLLTFFYYRTKNIFVSTLCRFLMKTAVLTPVIFFGKQAITAPDEFYMVVFFVYFLLLIAPYALYDEISILKNIVKEQTKRVVSFYARYGIETSKKNSLYGWTLYQAYLNERAGRSNLSTKELTAKYIKVSVAFSVAIVIIYAMLKGYFKFAEWQFLQDMGMEFVSVQISSTFLILSFLSFLTSRDDYILWLDTMSHKFIYPKYFNFVDTSIYAFTAMLFSLGAHMLGAEYVMLIFFIIGISILIRMTFKMINIFFNRNGLLVEIEQIYFSARIDEKNKLLSELYQNSIHVIEQNDCKKIQENFSFLAKLYSVYKRQCVCADNALITDEETGKKSVELSTIPDENINMILEFYLRYEDADGDLLCSPGFFSEDKDNIPDEVELLFAADDEDMSKLLARVESEITYFATLLLQVNPVLMAQLLTGYNSRLLEIDTLREKIKNYILSEIEEKGEAFAVPTFFRDVLGSYIRALRTAEVELTFLKFNGDSENEDSYILENSFIDKIHKCYENIRITYPDKYNGVCLNMLDELNRCYEKMKDLVADLKSAEESGNPAVCNSYNDWQKDFMKQYSKFKNVYTERKKSLESIH